MMETCFWWGRNYSLKRTKCRLQTLIFLLFIIERSRAYSFFLSVCLTVYLFVCISVCVQKLLHWPYLLIGKSKGRHISHEYTLWHWDLSVGSKFKVICQCQGRISRSQFFEKWPLWGHWCFTNTSCSTLFSVNLFVWVDGSWDCMG